MKVKLIDILKKAVKFDKKAKIFRNGEDNAYPETQDRLINNSVTAKMASLLMIQYLIGEGFGEALDDKIINSEEDLTLIDFATDVAEEITNQRGVYIHVGYNAETLQPIKPKVLPFDWCRAGKKDDKRYNGKILVKTDWSNTKEEAIEIDVYNDKKSVVKRQIAKAGGVKKYKGQIFYFNMDRKYFYPLSRIDSVQNDCDSEAQSSLYKNTLLRKGFFGKTLIVTRPMVDSKIEEHIYVEREGQEPLRQTNPKYINAKSEAKKAKEKMEEFVGAENAGGAMLIQMDNAGEDLDKTILFKNIESKIDPDLFQNVETGVRDNILVAFNNLPIGLVKASDGLFSNSAESIVEMKKTFWENTSKDREKVLYIVNKFYKAVTGSETNLEITSLIQETQDEGKAEAEKLKAQATLKGSVGVVTALLAIQQSVQAKTTDRESAVAIIEEIFGIDKAKAVEMLGKPEEEPKTE